MKKGYVDGLISGLRAMYDSGMTGLMNIDCGIDDFLDNYAHGPKSNILGQQTFIRERGVRNIKGKTISWAVFERAVIAKEEPHIGTLFAFEHWTTSVEGDPMRVVIAIEIPDK